MENASKALLIAAAVLVIILLIAFGMRVFNSAGTSTGDAESVGTALQEQMGAASEDAVSAITGTSGE